MSPSAFARIAGVAASALVAAWSGPSAAEEIVVSNFGVSANGMPYGVARAKNFFKEEGANVTGILTSGGGGNGWSLTGNAGTTPGTDFLGTTDNEAIEVHVDGMRGMRVEPTINDANHTGIVNVVNGASVNFDASAA